MGERLHVTTAHAGPSSKSPKLDVTFRNFVPCHLGALLSKGGLLFTITTTTTRHPCIFDVEDLCTASRKAILVIIELNQYKIVL
jgi:hypothetical protein